MAKRIKPKAQITDRVEAQAALREIAGLDRELSKIEADMNETIDQAKANAATDAADFEARRKELVNGLAYFAEVNKGALFKKKRSLKLKFGVIGFRMSAAIKGLPKNTLAMVLEKVKSYGFTDAVRLKEELNKDVMRAWTKEKLATVGAQLVVKDEFYIEINQEELADDAA